jgi:SAM-dependent methyltransferase
MNELLQDHGLRKLTSKINMEEYIMEHELAIDPSNETWMSSAPPIKLVNPSDGSDLIISEDKLVDSKGHVFPKIHGAFRLTGAENYTSNFGFQWNKFQTTQLDNNVSDYLQSKRRFFAETGWQHEDLEGKNILEVGCGAGRFSRVVLERTRANLYSIDYSDAVSANYRNNGHYGQRLRLFQASIYDMPFADNSFDKIFCFGVLQHTPDFEKSIECLVSKLKPGGELVVDFYPIRGWYTKLHAKYILRPFTRKMDHKKLLSLITKHAGRLIKTYRFFEKIKLGKIVNRFLPICDISNTFPPNLTETELKEWVILDTFDMFSPAHDHPQRIATVASWFKKNNMKVEFADYIIYDNNKAAVVKGIKL